MTHYNGQYLVGDRIRNDEVRRLRSLRFTVTLHEPEPVDTCAREIYTVVCIEAPPQHQSPRPKPPRPPTASSSSA